MRDPKYTRTNYSEWHHIWFFGLMEGSDPVDMHDRCNGAEWRTVSTEETFIQGLVNGITYRIYNPHNVEFACMKSGGETPVPAKPAVPAKSKR